MPPIHFGFHQCICVCAKKRKKKRKDVNRKGKKGGKSRRFIKKKKESWEKFFFWDAKHHLFYCFFSIIIIVFTFGITNLFLPHSLCVCVITDMRTTFFFWMTTIISGRRMDARIYCIEGERKGKKKKKNVSTMK